MHFALLRHERAALFRDGARVRHGAAATEPLLNTTCSARRGRRAPRLQQPRGHGHRCAACPSAAAASTAAAVARQQSDSSERSRGGRRVHANLAPATAKLRSLLYYGADARTRARPRGGSVTPPHHGERSVGAETGRAPGTKSGASSSACRAAGAPRASGACGCSSCVCGEAGGAAARDAGRRRSCWRTCTFYLSVAPVASARRFLCGCAARPRL